jgi:hypothetical protein
MNKALLLYIFLTFQQITVFANGIACTSLLSQPRFSSSEIEKLDTETLKTFLSKPTFRGNMISEHPWNDILMTSPLQHDPKNFMYVIHAKKNGVPNELPQEGSSQFISGSLITNNYVKAFGRFGYILDVRAENVIATWPVDGQSTRQDPWSYRKTQGVYSPLDLIDRSGWFWLNHKELIKVDIYNEVLLDSGAKDRELHKVKIVGLYVILDHPKKELNASGIDPVALGWEGPPLTEKDLLAAKKLAEQYSVPLITIYKSNTVSYVDRRVQ